MRRKMEAERVTPSFRDTNQDSSIIGTFTRFLSNWCQRRSDLDYDDTRDQRILRNRKLLARVSAPRASGVRYLGNKEVEASRIRNVNEEIIDTEDSHLLPSPIICRDERFIQRRTSNVGAQSHRPSLMASRILEKELPRSARLSAQEQLYPFANSVGGPVRITKNSGFSEHKIGKINQMVPETRPENKHATTWWRIMSFYDQLYDQKFTDYPHYSEMKRKELSMCLHPQKRLARESHGFKLFNEVSAIDNNAFNPNRQLYAFKQSQILEKANYERKVEENVRKCRLSTSDFAPDIPRESVKVKRTSTNNFQITQFLPEGEAVDPIRKPVTRNIFENQKPDRNSLLTFGERSQQNSIGFDLREVFEDKKKKVQDKELRIIQSRNESEESIKHDRTLQVINEKSPVEEDGLSEAKVLKKAVTGKDSSNAENGRSSRQENINQVEKVVRSSVPQIKVSRKPEVKLDSNKPQVKLSSGQATVHDYTLTLPSKPSDDTQKSYLISGDGHVDSIRIPDEDASDRSHLADARTPITTPSKKNKRPSEIEKDPEAPVVSFMTASALYRKQLEEKSQKSNEEEFGSKKITINQAENDPLSKFRTILSTNQDNPDRQTKVVEATEPSKLPIIPSIFFNATNLNTTEEIKESAVKSILVNNTKPLDKGVSETKKSVSFETNTFFNNKKESQVATTEATITSTTTVQTQPTQPITVSFFNKPSLPESVPQVAVIPTEGVTSQTNQVTSSFFSQSAMAVQPPVATQQIVPPVVNNPVIPHQTNVNPFLAIQTTQTTSGGSILDNILKKQGGSVFGNREERNENSGASGFFKSSGTNQTAGLGAQNNVSSTSFVNPNGILRGSMIDEERAPQRDAVSNNTFFNPPQKSTSWNNNQDNRSSNSIFNRGNDNNDNNRGTNSFFGRNEDNRNSQNGSSLFNRTENHNQAPASTSTFFGGGNNRDNSRWNDDRSQQPERPTGGFFNQGGNDGGRNDREPTNSFFTGKDKANNPLIPRKNNTGSNSLFGNNDDSSRNNQPILRIKRTGTGGNSTLNRSIY